MLSAQTLYAQSPFTLTDEYEVRIGKVLADQFPADREGVELAIKAGYVPGAVVRLLQTYVILGEQMPNTPKEAKTNLEARIAQIRTFTASNRRPRPPAEKPLALP